MFGLPKKKTENTKNASGFKRWLESNEEFGWAALYVLQNGDIDWDKATSDAQHAPNRMYAYTAGDFKSFLAERYAEYLGVEAQTLSMPEAYLLTLLQNMPDNVSFRRVRPKASGNKWAVRYMKGTVYYGKTLSDAIVLLLEHNEVVRGKYEARLAAAMASNSVAEPDETESTPTVKKIPVQGEDS